MKPEQPWQRPATDGGQLEELLDALSGIGPIYAKRFFGGTALMFDGTQFGFYVKGDLYLRVDDGNRAVFEASGSRPFQYQQSNGKVVVVKAFYAVPEPALDDRGELCRLARGAIDAGLRIDRAKAAKPARRRGASKT